MTHDELVDRAVKWLYSYGCGYAVGELKCASATGEEPDAIGFKSCFSILIECKTSRADFLADKKKHFRQNPSKGMGDMRLFLCEENLISPDELPDKWGLLYMRGKKVIKVVFPRGNMISSDFKQEKNIEAEHTLMYSCLRRGE